MSTTLKMRSIARRFLPLVLVALLGSVLCSCAGKKSGLSGPVFFPPAPDNPRLQYLGGITDSTDIEGKQSSFSLFLTGNEQAGVIKKIGKGYGIAVAKGKLYICASASGQIVVIDFAAKKFDYLAGTKGKGTLKKPVNIAIDDDGFLYVVDSSRNEIVVYDAAGNYVKAFGKGEGKSKVVAAAAFGQLLYVLDNGTNEIRVFNSKTGEQVQSIGGRFETSVPGTLVSAPTGIAIDATGVIYVTNIGNGTVMKFDRDGHFLSKFGKFGDSYGEFARPRGIAVDDTGRIFVVDAGHQNVQIFDNNARLLTFFGNPDPKLEAGALNLPAGIAVTKDNLQIFQQQAAPGFQLENVLFVLNQYGKPSISVYGLGEMQAKKP